MEYASQRSNDIEWIACCKCSLWVHLYCTTPSSLHDKENYYCDFSLPVLARSAVFTFKFSGIIDHSLEYQWWNDCFRLLGIASFGMKWPQFSPCNIETTATMHQQLQTQMTFPTEEKGQCS